MDFLLPVCRSFHETRPLGPTRYRVGQNSVSHGAEVLGVILWTGIEPKQADLFAPPVICSAPRLNDRIVIAQSHDQPALVDHPIEPYNNH